MPISGMQDNKHFEVNVHVSMEPHVKSGQEWWGIALHHRQTDPNIWDRYTILYYFPSKRKLVVSRTNSTDMDAANTNDVVMTLPQATGTKMNVQVFFDHSVLEVFVDQRYALSTRIYPPPSSSVQDSSIGILTSHRGSWMNISSVDVWSFQIGSSQNVSDPYDHSWAFYSPFWLVISTVVLFFGFQRLVKMKKSK
jgi:hypothetical protein